MAVKSGFFMSVNGDRRYDASFFAEYFSSFIGNGIFPNPSTNLQVVEGNNMQTVVKAGKAWINGYYLHNDSDLVLQHGVAHGTMKRIDRIVVRWNVLTRQMVIEILKGANATSPVAPAITRDTNYYDLVLADVYINAGTIQITQANITDQRLNSALCGVVTQTVKTVDTSTLFNQYQSWLNQQKANYESDLAAWTTAQKGDFSSWRNTQQTAFTNWMAAEKSEFDAWFENLQGVLNGDVVANLQKQIDQHKLENASTTAKGHVQLSNATDSASEILAATPKAVKAVNDKLGTLAILQTTTKTDLVGAVNELFTNVSNGKNLIGTAITDVDENVVVPSEPSFADLADLISGISTGKKWSSGTAMLSANYTAFQYAYSTGASNMFYVTVSGLDFKPSYIIVIGRRYNNNLDLGISLYMNKTKTSVDSYYNDAVWLSKGVATTEDATSYGFKANALGAFVNSTGFRLPVNSGDIKTFEWFAFE